MHGWSLPLITVTGRTFDHRELLLRHGGRWNNADRNWQFDHLSASQIATFRSTVGLVVVETASTADDIGNMPRDEFDRLLANLIGDKSTRPINNQRSNLYGDDPTYHNHFADQNPSAFFGFSSLAAFTDYVDGQPLHVTRDPGRTGWDTDVLSQAFSGTASMSEAVKIARQGWGEGVDRALDMIDRLSLANPRVRRRKPSLAGGVVNVGRMLSGDPAHMVRRPKQPGTKVVTFFVEAGCSGVINASTMAHRAAAIGAMIDIMEQVGYSCTVVATDTSLGHDDRAKYQLTVTVKESGERLNLSDLMFALGHPSFLRRLSFATCCSVGETRSIWTGQGAPSNAFDEDHPCGPGEFYVPVLTSTQQRALTDDPLSMIPFVTPANLPIVIEGSE